MEEHDVVIVGSGPAGASAGYFLKKARPEMDVLIIDRLDDSKYDRYHRMCGEAVSTAAFKELAPLRPDPAVHTIRRVCEHWPGGKVLVSKAQGYILDRPAFLKGVLSGFKRMGGAVLTDGVAEVVPEGDRFRLALSSGRSVRSGFVLGADGARSAVRRSLFREEPPVVIWTEQYLVRKKVENDLLTFIQGERYRGGYRWEFPAGGLARIGFPRGTDSVTEEVVEVHRRAIPAGGLGTIVRGRAMLLGDAAAMANPLTAGGIRVAMLSGRRAAESIAAGDPSAYQRWWDHAPFSQDKYLKAYRRFRGMTDPDYERAAGPFSNRVGAASLMWAYLIRPEFRDLYRAYGPSGKYGW